MDYSQDDKGERIMKQMKHKMKYVLLGLVIGVILTLTISPIGAVTQTVTAYLRPGFQFYFDGEPTPLTAGQSVLVFNDRSYVPARFVAENMGGEVLWDEENQRIHITLPEPEVIEVEIEEPEEEEEAAPDERQPSGNYREVPVKQTYRDMDLTVTLVRIPTDTTDTAVTTRSNYTTVYIELENKGDIPLRLEQAQTVAVVDGKTIRASDVTSLDRDSTWYSDVMPEETEAGFIRLPLVPDDAEKMKLSVVVLTNDRSQELRTVDFYIELDL